ncbi:MAG: peroxide stress protein YaaA, partial [Caulobacteraceae bacterium]
MATHIAELAKVTRRLTKAHLRRLMDISDNLALLNYERFQAFDPDSEEGVQAAMAFDGDVYAGLQARTLDKAGLAFAQRRLRILSGLYGLLRPLDLIQPYRLEMGTRLKTRRGASLYDFWGPRISQALNEAAEGTGEPVLVNLASQEYFAAVDRQALKLPVVTCHFRELKGEEPARVISFYAKKARGMMARFAIDNRIDRAEDLKAFTVAGYAFDQTASDTEDWVFVRRLA